jgi:hypothetical protein
VAAYYGSLLSVEDPMLGGTTDIDWCVHIKPTPVADQAPPVSA